MHVEYVCVCGLSMAMCDCVGPVCQGQATAVAHLPADCSIDDKMHHNPPHPKKTDDAVTLKPPL